MSLRQRTLWSTGAKGVGLGVGALAMWVVVDSVRSISRDGRSPSSNVASAVLLVILTILLSGVLLWIAWRLWRRWSSGTVRIVTGIALAWASISILDLLSGSNAERRHALDLAAAPVLILAAVAYRRTSRAVIRRADLEDPLDAHGHPAGHMERVRAFCIMLGTTTWLGAFDVTTAMYGSGMPRAAGIGTVVSAVVGWAVYRTTLWWMTPPTRPDLPPGRGFDVLRRRRKAEISSTPFAIPFRRGPWASAAAALPWHSLRPPRACERSERKPAARPAPDSPFSAQRESSARPLRRHILTADPPAACKIPRAARPAMRPSPADAYARSRSCPRECRRRGVSPPYRKEQRHVGEASHAGNPRRGSVRSDRVRRRCERREGTGLLHVGGRRSRHPRRGRGGRGLSIVGPEKVTAKLKELGAKPPGSVGFPAGGLFLLVVSDHTGEAFDSLSTVEKKRLLIVDLKKDEEGPGQPDAAPDGKKNSRVLLIACPPQRGLKAFAIKTADGKLHEVKGTDLAKK